MRSLAQKVSLAGPEDPEYAKNGGGGSQIGGPDFRGEHDKDCYWDPLYTEMSKWGWGKCFIVLNP